MALIPCPECGREISDAAPSCPQCGHPMKEKSLDRPQSRDQAQVGIVESMTKPEPPDLVRDRSLDEYRKELITAEQKAQAEFDKTVLALMAGFTSVVRRTKRARTNGCRCPRRLGMPSTCCRSVTR